MRVAEIIATIAKSGGHLRIVDGNHLDYVGKTPLAPKLRSEVRRRKEEILSWLRTPIDAQPREDQLALDYEPTLPGWLVDRLFDDTLPCASRVLDLCERLERSQGRSRTRSMKEAKSKVRRKRRSSGQRGLWE